MRIQKQLLLLNCSSRLASVKDYYELLFRFGSTDLFPFETHDCELIFLKLIGLINNTEYLNSNNQGLFRRISHENEITRSNIDASNKCVKGLALEPNQIQYPGVQFNLPSIPLLCQFQRYPTKIRHNIAMHESISFVLLWD